MFSCENMSILFSAQSINSNYSLHLPHITKTLNKNSNFSENFVYWVSEKTGLFMLSHKKNKFHNEIGLLTI